MATRIKLAMVTYGRIKEFSPSSHSMKLYLEEIEAYFAANRIEDEQKAMILLSSIGPTYFSVKYLE